MKIAKELFVTLLSGILLWVGVIALSVMGGLMEANYWLWIVLLFVIVPLVVWIGPKLNRKKDS